MNSYDYVIIGNSAGAVGCIEGLRTVDRSGAVALIAQETHHVYSRALIPYYLSGSIDRERMYYRPLNFYRQARVSLLAGQRAVRIDAGKKEVELDSGGRVGYGRMLLATGGRPVIPPIPGLDRANVFTFATYDDAFKIEKALPGAKRAVVLGGGVIGLMAAEALTKKGLEVTVLELAERVLAPVVDEVASSMVENSFSSAGVRILTGTTIGEIHGKERVEEVVLTGGEVVPLDLLVVGVGVVPRTEIAEESGIEVARGIVVDKKMRTCVPDIYACGDCASIYDYVMGQNRPLPLWPNAYAGGRVAAFNMAGGDREYTWGTSMNSMHFFNLYIINAGLNVLEKDRGQWNVFSRLDEKGQVYRKFILDGEGRIRGFILVGEVDRAGICLNLMRREIDVRGMEKNLAGENFGYACMNDDLKWQLLKDDVLLGVV